MTTNWSQDVFSKGELSPMMYSRVTVDGYYKALRLARNTITYPQGAVGKRFGSQRISTISTTPGYEQSKYMKIASWTYLNQGTYIVVFSKDVIDIFFMDNLVYSIPVANYYHLNEIEDMDYTVLDTRLRFGTGRLLPKEIVRSALTTQTIDSFGPTQLNASLPTQIPQQGFVVPVVFPATVPVSVNTLSPNVVYYAYYINNFTLELYFNAEDAKARVNKVIFDSLPPGVLMNTLGAFNIADMSIPVYNFPQYDFGDYPYAGLTFSLDARTGYVALTASAAFFNDSFTGGTFIYGGGVAYIGIITSPTVARLVVKQSFDEDIIAPKTVSGEDVVITKRAWSDQRGWPKVFGSYQSRALCAATKTLPNGFWASATKDYSDFNDTFTEDADPIGYYPASNMTSQINYIAAYRSLCVFTSNGVYSTPLSQNQAITPKNFALLLQEQTKATSAYPVGLDNRVVFISGNDVNLMDWDGLNNAYNTNIASIMSDHLINRPVDQDVYVDLNKAGSRYCFIINQDGTNVIFQSLSSEEVLGFTSNSSEQSYGNAYYRQVATTNDGNAYFIMERQKAYDSATVSTGLQLVGEIWSAAGINLEQYNYPFTAVRFGTPENLPLTEPVQVGTEKYYYAVHFTASTFRLYETAENARTQTDPILIIDPTGAPVDVTPWPLQTEFVLEKMNQDVKVDEYSQYNGPAIHEIPVGSHLNAQEIVANADGYEFRGQVYNGTLKLLAHGQERTASTVYAGHKITSVIEPLPISLPGSAGYKESSLVFPTHVRMAIFTFTDTIGGTINGTPIQMKSFVESAPGYPPSPQTGAFQMSIMGGWDEFKSSSIHFEHDSPYDFKLTGIFYRVEN